MHTFAQIFSANSVDGKSENLYLAHQIEPELRLNGSSQRGGYLTVVAMLEGTGKPKRLVKLNEESQKLNSGCETKMSKEARNK